MIMLHLMSFIWDSTNSIFRKDCSRLVTFCFVYKLEKLYAGSTLKIVYMLEQMNFPDCNVSKQPRL